MAKTNNKNVSSKKKSSVTKKKVNNVNSTNKRSTTPKKKIVVEDIVKKETISEKDAKLVKKTIKKVDGVKDITTKIPIKKPSINQSQVKEVTTKIPVKKINKGIKKELTKEELVAQRKERNRKKYQSQQRKYQNNNKTSEKKKIVVEDQIEKKFVIEKDANLIKKEKTTDEKEKAIKKREREERKEKRKRERKPINITKTLVNIKEKSVVKINEVKEKTTDQKIPVGKTKIDKKIRFKRFIKEAVVYAILLTIINTICILTIDYFDFLRLFDVKYLNIILTIAISLIFNFFVAFMIDYFVTEVWLKNKRKEKDGEQNGDSWFDEGEYQENIKNKE